MSDSLPSVDCGVSESIGDNCALNYSKKMKSMTLGGILVQPYGINCDAKILDTLLSKEMIISVKKKKQEKQESDINYLLKTHLISNIKANGLKMKGWKEICCFCCLDAQLNPTLL